LRLREKKREKSRDKGTFKPWAERSQGVLIEIGWLFPREKKGEKKKANLPVKKLGCRWERNVQESVGTNTFEAERERRKDGKTV